MTDAAPGPLAGLRVLEASTVVAGPFCGQLLADLGADVVKVERYPRGDDTRAFAPPALAGESAVFMGLNRNKRGIVVNLRDPAGQDVFRRLARDADIVVENNRRGVMERLGIGYAQLRADNPGLIYAAISGFGRTGPYADRGGYDLIAQAMSGLMAATGEAPGRPPVKTAGPIADLGAGLYATIAILAALVDRARTGAGQYVEASLLEAAIATTVQQTAMTLVDGVSPPPMGTAHPTSAPYQAFRASDGWVALGASMGAIWPRFCAAIGRPGLVDDPRFADPAGRNVNLAALQAEIGAVFATRTVADWLARLEAADVPCGPVLSVADMLENEQVAARGVIVETAHATAGTVRALAPAMHLARTPAAVRRAAPALGEHTAEVLAEAGYGADEIAALARDGIVVLAGA